jgi:hypothetical protein
VFYTIRQREYILNPSSEYLIYIQYSAAVGSRTVDASRTSSLVCILAVPRLLLSMTVISDLLTQHDWPGLGSLVRGFSIPVLHESASDLKLASWFVRRRLLRSADDFGELRRVSSCASRVPEGNRSEDQGFLRDFMGSDSVADGLRSH